MKRFAIVLAAALMLFATGCSRIKFVPLDQARMANAAFTNPTATIKAGEKIKFFNDSDATHILVVGTNGAWTAMTGAPTDLNNSSGKTISPHSELDIVFDTAGTYTVTCTIHPAMLVTITVN
jgi:plastocyanin